LSATVAPPTSGDCPGTSPIVVLGIGNALMGDDGVGVRVVAELEAARAAGRLDLPTDVELVDAGSAGLALLPWLAAARAAVIVDAATGGSEPGTVAVWRDAEVAERPAGDHGRRVTPLGELLAIARLTRALPAVVSLVGIEPHSVAPGELLSRPVLAAVPAALARTVVEIHRVDALSCPRPAAGLRARPQGVTA
jgi:hydrogenase maturation protease